MICGISRCNRNLLFGKFSRKCIWNKSAVTLHTFEKSGQI